MDNFLAIPLATSPKAIESEKVKYELPDAYLRHLISYHGVFMLKQAAISLSTIGEYGTLPLSQCAWFYASGNILATTCSPYSLPLEFA